MAVAPAGRGPQVQGVAACFVALSTIAIVLRCYCRAVVVKSFGIDDLFAVIAWVFFIFFCGFAITGVHHGTGQHVTSIPPHELPIGLKWWWACEPVYVLSNMALKVSIGVFLLRLTVVRTHRVIIWTVITVSQVYGVFYFFLFVLQCRPSAYFWTRLTGGKGTCINPNVTVNATYVYSGISCACDWTLGTIPIFMVWNLQMNLRTKLSVAMILALGAVASTATVIRIPFVKEFSNEADFLYATTNVALLSTSETGIGITASACATLRPLFRSYFSRSQIDDSEPQPSKKSWPKPTATSYPGYTRHFQQNSLAEDHMEEFKLRDDIGTHKGVVTTIESDADNTVDLERGGLDGLERGNAAWNNSESKLTEVPADEDVAWEDGDSEDDCFYTGCSVNLRFFS